MDLGYNREYGALLSRVPVGLERENRILEAATGSPSAVSGPCGTRALTGGTAPDVAKDPYPFNPSPASLNTLVLRVAYRS